MKPNKLSAHDDAEEHPDQVKKSDSKISAGKRVINLPHGDKDESEMLKENPVKHDEERRRKRDVSDDEQEEIDNKVDAVADVKLSPPNVKLDDKTSIGDISEMKFNNAHYDTRQLLWLRKRRRKRRQQDEDYYFDEM